MRGYSVIRELRGSRTIKVHRTIHRTLSSKPYTWLCTRKNWVILICEWWTGANDSTLMCIVRQGTEYLPLSIRTVLCTMDSAVCEFSYITMLTLGHFFDATPLGYWERIPLSLDVGYCRRLASLCINVKTRLWKALTPFEPGDIGRCIFEADDDQLLVLVCKEEPRRFWFELSK